MQSTTPTRPFLPTFSALLLAVLFTPALAEDAGEWKSLFNGENLEGWTNPYGWGKASAENGELRLRSKKNFFLITEKTYGDFILEGEVKMPEGKGNSGFLFRGHAGPGGRSGYQAEIGPTTRGFSGGLYNVGSGWLVKSADDPEAEHAFKLDQWNKFRIEARGNHIQIFVNGVKTTDYRGDEYRSGHIAIQHHGYRPTAYRFRNLRIKPLSENDNAGNSGERTTWSPLFNGENLSGWTNPYDWGEARVEEGEIRLTADKKFFLITEKTYGDFIFEAEVKMPEGKANSGFMFRAHAEPNRVWGYQAEVDPSGRQWAGGLYDEGRRGWLNPLKDQPEAQKAFDRDKWNKYRIVARGDHIQIFVNGVKTTDYRDATDLAGHIALQHHGEDGKVYRFRNIRIKPLGRHEWKPIFNGENLDGWHTRSDGTDKWSVKNGAIVGVSPSSDRRHGLLISDDTYEDFTARLDFRVLQGNSGFYFRAKERPNHRHGVRGFQAEIDRTTATGGLYEAGGRGAVAKPDAQQIKEHYTPGEWATMTVSAHGNRIVIHVNGHKTVDFTDTGDPASASGPFALQLHGNQDMHVEFRDLKILRKTGK